MSRPRFYRDPIHKQIRYDSVDRAGPMPADPAARFSWVMQRLIDAPEFQRLRHIRQNALANVVFHGAEHSRFCHSMGAAHLAAKMYDRIVRNMGEEPEPDRKLATCAAALLHDLGHGPFSHTLEYILDDAGVTFQHETMTMRFLREDTGVRAVLAQVRPDFPEMVAAYVDKGGEEHWSHKLVSSQLDADRMDYLLRDATASGLLGQTFDLSWLLDSLGHVDGTRIAVDHRAIEAVETYLVALDQMYRIVYFHHAVRAADLIVSGALRRAFHLWRDRGDERVFATGVCTQPHPLRTLFENGDRCPLDQYARLGEFQVWTCIEDWSFHEDPILADLSRRILRRDLLKAVDLADRSTGEVSDLVRKAEKATLAQLDFLDPETVEYYVTIDEPARTSYKRFDWRSENSDESIWIVRKDRDPVVVDQYPGSEIVQGLQRRKHFPRLMVLPEVREVLRGG